MADYFTLFSCQLDVGTPENATRALDLYESGPEDKDGIRISDGFLLTRLEDTILWIHDDCSGDPERVIQFVLLCAERLDLKGRWGFEYANTCSRPRLDGFGGGAHVLDLATGETVDRIYTGNWLHQTLSGEGGPL